MVMTVTINVLLFVTNNEVTTHGSSWVLRFFKAFFCCTYASLKIVQQSRCLAENIHLLPCTDLVHVQDGVEVGAGQEEGGGVRRVRGGVGRARARRRARARLRARQLRARHRAPDGLVAATRTSKT